MPISRYNPDGTVDIYNKKTGEVKRGVKPEELPNISPNLVAEYEMGQSPEAVLQRKETEMKVKQMETDPDYGLSATDKKNKGSLDAVNNLINTLEGHYQGAGGAKSSIGPLSRILGLKTDWAGDLGLNDASKLYQNEKEGFAATLKSLTGDTGVLTDQDFARLSKLIPGLGATQGEATGAFNDLRSQVAAKYGGNAENTTFDPSVYKPKETGNPLTDALQGNEIINALLGTSIRTANDAGMGIRSRKLMPEIENLQKQAEDIGKQAMQTEDPQQQKQLMDEANRLSDMAIELNNELSGGYSQDADMNPALRGLSTGSQVASVASIPSLVKGSVNAVSKVPGAVKGTGSKVFSQGAGSTMRNTAVETAEQTGKTLDGNKIVGAVDDWAVNAKRANPQAVKSIDKYVEGVKSQFADKPVSPKEAFQLWDDASKGFTAAGTKGSSLQASYHRAVRDLIRKELDGVAPGFEKGTQLIRQGLGRTDTAKSVGKIAGSTAIGGLTSLLLYKILFGGKGTP